MNWTPHGSTVQIDQSTAGRRQRESLAQRISSCLAEHALSLGIVAGLLGILGVVLGSGIAGYPTLAEDEGACLEQAWALNLGAVSHYTPWRDHPPLGWVPLWFMGNLTGALISGHSALAQGRITMLVPALSGAVLLYVLTRRGPHDVQPTRGFSTARAAA